MTLEIRIWKILQVALIAVSAALVFLLFYMSPLGIDLFWNLLIPAAPALLIIAPGIWRNICPLSTTSLLPRRFGLSKKMKMPENMRSTLYLLSVVLLILIVPLRHTHLNMSGPMTAFMLLGAVGVAVVMGLIFDRKSGWCSTLCPIHPVERLYGINVAYTPANAQCNECALCSQPCPESIKQMTHVRVGKSTLDKVAYYIMVGGLPGFLYGWYQVPDVVGIATAAEILGTFTLSLGGMAVTGGLYLILRLAFKTPAQLIWLDRVFVTAAICCYYWYRLPALIGFGPLEGQWMLVDLSTALPVWTAIACQAITTSFFVWFLLIRPLKKASWSVRPAYEAGLG